MADSRRNFVQCFHNCTRIYSQNLSCGLSALLHCYCPFDQGRVAGDTQGFPHLARFYNYNGQFIVRADIHQGLCNPAIQPRSHHRPHLTFWHWSGVTPYTSSCEFAGSCVFDKQSAGLLSLRPAPLFDFKRANFLICVLSTLVLLVHDFLISVLVLSRRVRYDTSRDTQKPILLFDDALLFAVWHCALTTCVRDSSKHQYIFVSIWNAVLHRRSTYNFILT